MNLSAVYLVARFWHHSYKGRLSSFHADK